LHGKRAAAQQSSEKLGNHMTIKAHLIELERRHHALESAIHEASKHKSSDDLEMMKLKRQKLHLKDEIERLQHDHNL
jgi:hypothetical protein